MLVFVNVGGLFRNEVMGVNGRLCVAWLVDNNMGGISLGGVTVTLLLLAVTAGVVTFEVDLALLTGVLKLTFAPLEDLSGRTEPGRVVDLRIVLIRVVGLPVDEVIVEVDGDVCLTAEAGGVVCLRTELVGDVALLEELGSVLDL